MNGPIRRITRERKEDRSTTTVPTAWISNGRVNRTWRGGTWLSVNGPAPIAQNASPALLMFGADAAADKILRHHLATAGRAYVLLGPGADLEGASNNALVRRVPEVPTSALHTMTESRVWIGGGLSLKLEGQQAEALRQVFLRLFWHEASQEAWLDGRQLVWRPARERPFDVPEVPASAAIRCEAPDARVSLDPRGARMHLRAGEPPAVAPRRLWFRAGAEHHERLAKLAQSGAEVLWDDLDLPDLAVAEVSGEMLLPGTRGRLRIRLTPAQAREAGALLDEGASWTFRSDVRIGDPTVRHASLWLAGEGSARTLEEVQSIEIAVVPATSLRELHATDPTSWPASQPLALAALYRWPVVPPRVPAGSEEDQLVKRWRALDDEWTKRLSGARDALMSSGGERSRLGMAFSRLLAGLLGFERTHGELMNEAEALGAERPSKAGPDLAAALLARLTKLEDATKKHQGDLEDAERKAREEDEQEKQQLEWTAQLDRAKTDAEQARKELEREEQRESELANEARDLEDRAKDATPEERKDLEVKRKRNSDERKSNEKAVKKLRYDLRKHEDDAARPFTFNATKLEPKRQQPPGKRFVPAATSARPSNDVPEDALPEVGSLRTHKGQRYLVIDDWEHLEAGEQAAARLAAKLVAPEDA